MPLTSAERVRKHREKKKMDVEMWKAEKAKERERIKNYRLKKKLTMSKKEVAEKRRKETEQKRAQRAKNKQTEDKIKSETVPTTSSMSPQVLGKAVKRIKTVLPPTPNKQIPIISNVIQSWSPNKVQMLSKELNMNYSNVNKTVVRKKRADALSEDNKREISNFYKQDSISRILPGKKEYVSVKDIATGKRVKLQKRILVMKIKEAYQLFKEQSKISIGFSMFAALRPADVFPISEKDHEVCMCMYHENVQLLVDVLNNISSLIKLPTSAEATVKETICCFDLEDEKTINCCKRVCNDCSVEVFVDSILDSNKNDIEEETEVSFYQWKRIEGKMMKQLITCDLLQAKEELISQLLPFSLHMYTAHKQHAEFKHLKQHLVCSNIIIHEDFAENYAIKYQGEIMAAHWSSEQVTLFTCIVYYRDDQTLELKHMNYVIISDEINHTKEAVYAFNFTILNDVKQTRTINCVHFWSDGCGAQFKNRYNMQNLMLHKEHYNVEADWSFFGTAHGKGAIDGLGAVVKRNVWLATLRKQYNINSAEEFAKAAEKETSNIKILYVSAEEIQTVVNRMELKEQWKKASPVQGIHNIHFAKPLDNGNLGLWNHSCFSKNKLPDEEIKLWLPKNEKKSHEDSLILPVQTSDWVAVLYDEQWWPGIVEAIDEDYLHLSFMKPIGMNKFTWPSIPEKDKVLQTNILAKLEKPPNPVNSRGHFALSHNDVKKIEDVIDVLQLR